MHAIAKPFHKYLVALIIFSLAAHIIYLVLPLYMMVVYDRVLFSFSMASLLAMVAVVLISLATVGLIDYLRSKVLEKVGNNLAQRLIPFVLKVMHRDAAALNRKGYTRGLHDIECLRALIVRGSVLPLFDIPWMFIYLGFLLFIHPLIGGVVAGMLFLVVIFHFLLRSYGHDRYTTANVVFYQQAERTANNLVCHADVTTAMGMQSAIIERFQGGYKKVCRVRNEAEAFSSTIGSVLGFLCQLVAAMVFGAGVFVFFDEKITTGAIFAVVLITIKLLAPFERLLWDLKDSIDGIDAYKRLCHFLSEQEPSGAKLSLPTPAGRLEAEGVSLLVNGRALIQNISLGLEPGEMLGVLGASSAGKTTLCKVLLGVWSATTGKVRMDGAEIDQWPEEELRCHIGYLPQEPELFQATVAENIARLEVVDSEKVVRAAQLAGIHEIILQLSNGYDTKIDHTGKNLSASQRQLISLARALYNEPKFVVLDEPHTYLDEAGFRLVLAAIEALKKNNVSAIVVTDRSSLLVNMEKLLVLKEGQAIMYGPRHKVLEQLASKKQL